MDIIEKVREIATPIIDQNDCILFDVTFKKEGKDLFLRLFVDKKIGKIDLDLIVKIFIIVANHNSFTCLFLILSIN